MEAHHTTSSDHSGSGLCEPQLRANAGRLAVDRGAARLTSMAGLLSDGAAPCRRVMRHATTVDRRGL